MDVRDAIRQIGAQDKIALVHFRNIRGSPRRFAEVFIDEGDEDMGAAMRTYKEAGFAGPYLLDHMPKLSAPFDAFHARAYANGYIKALLQTVYGKTE